MTNIPHSMTGIPHCGEKVLANACVGSKYNSNRGKNKQQRKIYLCDETDGARLRAHTDLAEGKTNLTREVFSCLM